LFRASFYSVNLLVMYFKGRLSRRKRFSKKYSGLRPSKYSPKMHVLLKFDVLLFYFLFFFPRVVRFFKDPINLLSKVTVTGAGWMRVHPPAQLIQPGPIVPSGPNLVYLLLKWILKFSGILSWQASWCVLGFSRQTLIPF